MSPAESASGMPRGAGNRIITTSYDGPWDGLNADPSWPAASAYLVASNDDAVRAVWAHATGERETLIAAATRVSDEQAQEFRQSGLSIVRDGSIESATGEHDTEVGRIWLLTSGSTGRPKQVAHSLESLTTVGGDQPHRVWLCPYATGAYAWWQVVTLSLELPGQDVLFIEPSELDSWPERALEYGVSAASGTPTFWRQAMFRAGETLAQLPLQQITLGGEPVDQGVLDALRAMFPEARISWIYASSEAGAAIAVHDGHAGFPAAWLDRHTPGRPVLTIDDGELVIESLKAAEGMDPAIRTGDRVEIVDGRVLITGRIKSDEINVGGSKASAGKVRGVLLAHPDVAWAAVKGRKAPLVGNMVVAEVVLKDGATADSTALQSYCAQHLPDYSVPRRIRLLPEIPMKETLKSDV